MSSGGDGFGNSIQSHDDEARTHTYDEPGEYEVTISGTLLGWSYIGNWVPIPGTDAPKLVEIREWGGFDIGLEVGPSLRNNLRGATDLTVEADDKPSMRQGASLAWTFGETGINESSGLSSWDVSNVEDTHSMFRRAESFDGDLSGWDVSNVTDMRHMFSGSGLSRENYDCILASWQELDLEDGVEFSAGDTQYSPGEPAEGRQYIIDEYDWEISDGGVAN